MTTEHPRKEIASPEKCEICEMDEYDIEISNSIVQSAIREHDSNIIKLDGKHFCAKTLERAETPETWEEMSEEESKIAEREYIVKEKGKWKIMLRPRENIA
jgi:hypothetical protein